jgi:hypothetical protein
MPVKLSISDRADLPSANLLTDRPLIWRDPGAPVAVEYGTLEPIKEVDCGGRDGVPAYTKTSTRSHPVSDGPASRGDDDPDNFDNLMFLSPEQYEVLLKAREEQQHDLSREQVEAVLKALEERS